MEFLTAEIENEVLKNWNNELHKERENLLNQLRGQELANIVLIEEKLALKRRVEWLEKQWSIAANNNSNALVYASHIKEKLKLVQEDNENLKQDLSSETNNMIRNKLKTMLTLQADIVNLIGRV